MSKTTTYKVILPNGKRKGLLACGPYKPGAEYAVPAAEALRLVEVKGFEFVDKGAEKAARAEVQPAAAPATTQEG
jgi:hypothetical protein